MTIMSKEVNTPVGVVTITAASAQGGPEPRRPVIEYTARVEIIGLVYQYKARVLADVLATDSDRLYPNVERDLLRGLAMQLVKEVK